MFQVHTQTTEQPEHLPRFSRTPAERYVPNDPFLFPNGEPSQPQPIVTEDGTEEWYIDKIVDACQQGRSVQYLVRYEGYRKEHDEWRPGSEMTETEALDRWEEENGTDV